MTLNDVPLSAQEMLQLAVSLDPGVIAWVGPQLEGAHAPCPIVSASCADERGGVCLGGAAHEGAVVVVLNAPVSDAINRGCTRSDASVTRLVCGLGVLARIDGDWIVEQVAPGFSARDAQEFLGLPVLAGPGLRSTEG